MVILFRVLVTLHGVLNPPYTGNSSEWWLLFIFNSVASVLWCILHRYRLAVSVLRIYLYVKTDFRVFSRSVLFVCSQIQEVLVKVCRMLHSVKCCGPAETYSILAFLLTIALLKALLGLSQNFQRCNCLKICISP